MTIRLYLHFVTLRKDESNDSSTQGRGKKGYEEQGFP